MHIRGLHYKASQAGGLTRDGKPYLNIKEHFQQLTAASEQARILRLVDPELLVDRRNAAAVENVFAREHPEPGVLFRDLGDGLDGLIHAPTLRLQTGEMAVILPEVAAVEGYDYATGDQPCLVECWIARLRTGR